jgi:beta-1,4-mannosyl-glycoprotein beta-1,4-N-acetylglucosaminyltransferase
LGNIEKHRYTAFKQKNLFYKFNLINKTIPDWYGSKICKKKYLKSPQWLRKQKVKKFSMFKFFKIRWNIIENGGWHFSYLMEPKMIQEKLQSFAHAEYNSDYYTNLERIKAVINQKKDLFDRNQEYLKINLDDTFPKYITQNKKEFKKWII